MRLHAALDHIANSHYRAMETWGPGEPAQLARYIVAHAGETVEFSFSFLDTDNTADALETFIAFANDLWDAGIAPIPHNFFWVSWSQMLLGQTVHMAAFCEKVFSEYDNALTSLSVRVMFENMRRDGFAFVNQSGLMVVQDHDHVLISHADSESAGLLVENGFGVVKALMGALATPQAIRSEQPAPDRLNKQRASKGKTPIGPVIVIDVRASKQAASMRKGEGGWIVRPHWRRGHLRHLADGRVIPIPPCCVNMEDGIPVKPEYVVKV
ncbi:hypothetical protein Brsp07_04519 [Brucella sp. NBRC 14130]|uniref:hypothetical protein n=1 Tax=Brucella sp. NBRC 14130 TaxID=3075483 RepID=UPI0030A0A766